MITSLEGVSGQRHAPAALYSQVRPVLIVQEDVWAPGPVRTGAENLAFTGIPSPDLSARSQSLYRLRYPAQIHKKRLGVNADYTIVITISRLHNSLNIVPIRDFIHRLTAKFFAHCPSHPKPLVQQIGNKNLANQNSKTKYKHRSPKHILL